MSPAFTVEYIASELQKEIVKLVKQKQDALENANAGNPYTTEFMSDAEAAKFKQWVQDTKDAMHDLKRLKNGIDLLNKTIGEQK